MNATQLLARLDELDVGMVVEDGRLRVSAARGRLDEALQQAIRAHKDELLRLLAERAAARPGQDAPPAAIAREGLLPLSLFQERLWLMQRLDPDSTAFNMATVWLAPEGVTVERLAAAVGAVLAHHEILHAAFVDEGGQPGVRVLPVPPPLPVVDLRPLPPPAQRARVDEDLQAAVHAPFDLEREGPLRGSLYHLGDGRAAVLLSGHHIALDAWSMHLLVQQIGAACAGRPPAPAALQYADYAAWQRRAQDSQAAAADLDWWARRLHDAPQLSVFPTDQASASRAAGAAFDFELDEALTDGLRQLVREEGATLYMALMAACAAVLRAHTGQTDVVLGSPMGVRERPEFETMIGPFVNVQVVRLGLDDDPDFAALLRQARGALLDAHEHRHVPFERLIERLRPARSLNHAPLFQVAVVLHNATSQGVHGVQGEQGAVAITGGGALHDLTWFAREAGARMACSLEYRSDLYSREAIERIAAHLRLMLQAAVAERHRPLSRVSLLTPQDRALLQQVNATAAALDGARLAQQFERQAAATPTRVAVAFEGGQVTYAELNRRTNRLAHALRAQGVGPGDLVGVCVERSIEMVVALLAVQKAGGAYVPLDPAFPPERLRFMLEDSGARVLVTAGDAADVLALPPQVVLVDAAAPAAGADAHTAAGADADPPPCGSDADPAYVIYTSGSTGRPKGVAVSHAALANFLGAMRREPGLGADDVVAALTTISFDIAGLELYLPLTVGARIELIGRETAADAQALAEALEAGAVTVLQATPATWRMLLEVQWRPARPLRAFCGGEALPRDLADALLAQVAELWNLYGPTEATIWATVERIEPGTPRITVGRPIANTQVHVVGADGEPLPVGMPGEIWLGGVCVALGYHRRPELTAERFLPDRFSARPGALLYRTGDLGRLGRDGRLEHLGRIDHQVKVRGFRIELGEIEAVLGGHAAVRQCVAVAREAGPGDMRLVAYVVYQPGEDLTVSEVRRHLRTELPDYMIPSVVMALEAIPLTPNGKVDRKALPDPFKGMQAAADHVPPAPGMEQLLAEIWAEILQVERIGAEDNFFDLGGHSLLSVRVAAAVQRRTGQRLDPRSLFFQNLRQVAASVAAGGPA